MDPCPFVRVLVGNLALKQLPLSSRIQYSSSTQCYYCKIKLKGFPDQEATIPFLQQESASQEARSAQAPAACFSLNKAQIDNLVLSKKVTSLRIDVYSGSSGISCLTTDKLLGRLSVALDLRGAESKTCTFHNGWVGIGGNKKGSAAELFVTVRAEPDPRFVFQFGGEPECSPQVFQVQGNAKQAVFTCEFGFRNSSDRNLVSRPLMNEPSTPRSWLPTFGGEKEQTSKERKGWSITVHDLSGSPVAMASMVTPFVPSPGSDRVSRSNPGAWLILRPGNCTWKPWGRLEAWREPGNSDLLGYKFDLLHDTVSATSTATTLANSTLSGTKGGKFTIDMTTSVAAATPVMSPQGSCDFGSGSWSSSESRPGSGSGSDFSFCMWPQFMYRWFVMSSTVEGMGKCSKPEVEIGVRHVTCTEDAAAFVALGAAMDLSMDACRLFSQKLRKELRQQSQQSAL